VAVSAEGIAIAHDGIPYTVDQIVPDLGVVGMDVAFAKVGKTTFIQRLGADVAMGRPFLDRPTRQGRVLCIAAEDPPEYTAWLARNLHVSDAVMTFYRAPIVLDAAGLAAIVATVHAGSYRLVLISSWQAVVRGLIRDENDNAGAVRVVEAVKAAARSTGIPWLIDAHSGKGEDQTDDADPAKALRGASSAAGAADFMLSLRYDNGPFGTRRRLSGKGRFVNFEPIILDCDVATGTYTVIANTGKASTAESTWRLIRDAGAITDMPQTAAGIAVAAGLKVGRDGKATAESRRQVSMALAGREGIRATKETRRGQSATLYSLLPISDCAEPVIRHSEAEVVSTVPTAPTVPYRGSQQATPGTVAAALSLGTMPTVSTMPDAPTGTVKTGSGTHERF
jgi:hypothetical protein